MAEPCCIAAAHGQACGCADISVVTAYAPVRPDGTLWIDGMSDEPQTVFSNVVAFEGFSKRGWRECEAAGWRCIAVKVRPL